MASRGNEEYNAEGEEEEAVQMSRGEADHFSVS